MKYNPFNALRTSEHPLRTSITIAAGAGAAALVASRLLRQHEVEAFETQPQTGNDAFLAQATTTPTAEAAPVADAAPDQVPPPAEQ